ncbi:hypothetical protein O181_085125 [Austropuccinia psidii MF-1]|uniref:CCHC-type domain-containing protein n=1 Tax=Austropuccinia psidii MF-1 TaxID=1389203 RepID=A0A9Q3IMS9_9BASI|nr:hypothetical protein [Austropuccinia psidii MF-1]
MLNTLRRDNKHSQSSSPFIYHVSGSQDHLPLHSHPHSPYFAKPVASTSNVCRPPKQLVDKFGGSCFHCGHTGHWQADCPHTRSVTNPNWRPVSPGPFPSLWPGTPDCRLKTLSSPHYQREQVMQVKFVEHDATDCILIDTGASIHLSGSACFATNLKDVTPFRIFFANLNLSVMILQMMTLKIPVKNRSTLIKDVPFSTKISGTILSVNQLYRAGIVPMFSALLLSLLVCNVLLTTSFLNDCWRIDVVPREGTIVLAAETSSPCLFEMNPVSLPQSATLSLHKWHE